MKEETPKKFRITTLGCRTNQYESQAFRDQLFTLGYVQAGEGEAADLCIVNSCTVTESADTTSRHEIRQLGRQNPGARLVVTGCSADRLPEQIKAIEGVTDLIPNSEKELLLNHLFPDLEIPEFSIKNFDAHTRAFVKVQDGCNSYCSYCIIPYVRGRSHSRTIDEVVREVEGLVANGFKEVVLTGINIGDFDGGGVHSLAELVCVVDQIAGLERLRISSIDPDEVDDELLDAIINGRKTCQSMHVVLQAGSNVTLKRMNRKYTRQIFLETVDRLRAANSDFTFTTDVIVGFPGETEYEFEETLEVMREVEFAKVHMFPFSPRPRTRAAIMKNRVPPEVIRERKQRLLREAEEVGYRLRDRYVGRKMTILTENSEGGHTDNFLLVRLPDAAFATNELLDIELVSNSPSGLIGRLIAKERCCG